MTVAEMIAQRTAKLTAIKDSSNAAVTAKGGTAADDLSGLPAAIASIPSGGGALPVLTNPAAAGDVIAGKEYIDGNGDKKAGTLVVCDTVAEVDTLGSSGVGVNVEIESTADGSTKMLTLPEPNLKPENIKNGVSIFGIAGSAKTMRVETGTITPAEDTKSITVPCSNGAKAFVLIPNSAIISAVEGQAAKRYVTTAAANYEFIIDGAPNTAMQIWNLKSYANAGLLTTNTDGVKLWSSYYFYPGTYRWTAYYWEDDA